MRQRWTTFVAVATFLGFVVFVALEIRYIPNPVGDIAFYGAFLAFSVMGALVSRRSRGNRIGALYVLIGAFGVVAALVDGNLVSQFHPPGPVVLGPIGLTFAVVGSFAFWVLIALVTLAIHWFPTGRAPSLRWRWVNWWVWIAAVLSSAFTLLQPSGSIDGAGTRSFDNPIGVEGLPPPDSDLGLLVLMPVLLGFVFALVGLVVRFVRSKATERQQLKWLLFATSLLVFGFVVGEYVWFDVLRFDEPIIGEIGNEVISGLLLAGIPTATGLAVMRYRLFEIDRIVNRTVVYTIVIAVVLAVYGAVVIGVPALIGSETSSPLLVAGATLAAFLLFQPLRRRVQRLVDRRFNRSGYDTQSISDEVATTLRDEVDLEAIADEWARAVRESVEPESVSIWVVKPDSH